MPKEKPFPTEAGLCRRFLEGIAKEKGWTPYAETAGWDILLVRAEDGFQIGIQAKLKLNLDVVNQTLEDSYRWITPQGPDCRAVLVPDGEAGFDRIAAYIGFTIIRVRPRYEQGVSGPVFQPYLPKIKGDGWRDEWHEWCPTTRHDLPEYVPDVVAGSPSPVQLTDWKIGALKIQAILAARGHVTREDFRLVNIDHRRWLKPTGWLVVEQGRYIRGNMPDFARQHPKVYAQIVADQPKWMARADAKKQMVMPV